MAGAGEDGVDAVAIPLPLSSGTMESQPMRAEKSEFRQQKFAGDITAESGNSRLLQPAIKTWKTAGYSVSHGRLSHCVGEGLISMGLKS